MDSTNSSEEPIAEAPRKPRIPRTKKKVFSANLGYLGASAMGFSLESPLRSGPRRPWTTWPGHSSRPLPSW